MMEHHGEHMMSMHPNPSHDWSLVAETATASLIGFLSADFAARITADKVPATSSYAAYAPLGAQGAVAAAGLAGGAMTQGRTSELLMAGGVGAMISVLAEMFITKVGPQISSIYPSTTPVLGTGKLSEMFIAGDKVLFHPVGESSDRWIECPHSYVLVYDKGGVVLPRCNIYVIAVGKGSSCRL